MSVAGATPSPPVPSTGPGRVLVKLALALGWVNRIALWASMLALVAACLVLTTSVVLRYFLKVPTDWQDEVSVFLLVGATFFSAGHVQARRGHIGIDAVAGLLPPRVDAARRLLADVASLLFCGFFTWKSWALWYEAYSEGQTTSSSWAPPLALPYGLMSFGMSLLTAQLLLQCLFVLAGSARQRHATAAHPGDGA